MAFIRAGGLEDTDGPGASGSFWEKESLPPGEEQAVAFQVEMSGQSWPELVGMSGLDRLEARQAGSEIADRFHRNGVGFALLL